MTRLALLLALALGACACDVPQPHNDLVDAPAGAEDAISIAVTEWSERLEAELGDPPPVLWFGGRCLDYFLAGEGGPCRTGRTWEWWGDVEIHLIAEDLPSHTSLAHELLHWSLLETTGDQDTAHDHPLWAKVVWVRNAMRTAGL